MYARITPLFSLLLLAPPAADGWLGVYLEQDRNEAVIAEVIPGSPAAKAGLQVGDVMLAVGDQATANSAEFIAAIRKAAPGDRVRIKVQRKGQESIMIVKLGDRPETIAAAPVAPASPHAAKGQPARPSAESAPVVEAPAAGIPATDPGRGYLGLSVQETSGGVRIERVLADSPARKAGLAEGDVLLSVGDQQVRSLEDLDRWITKVKPGTKVAVGLRGDEGVRSVLVEIGSIPGPTRDPRGASSGVEVRSPEPAVRATRSRAAVAAKPQEAASGAKAAPEAVPEKVAERAAASAASPSATPVDVERELESLRAELRDLRKQLEALRKSGGRE